MTTALPAPPTRPDGFWQASDGNWYPPQQEPGSAPQQPAKKKSHKVRWAVLGLAVVIIAIVAATSSGGSKKATTRTPSTVGSAGGSATTPSGTHKIGDTATTSGWQVTVYGVKDPWTSTNQFITPAAGSRYVQVDVQVRNTKSSQQSFSSVLSFKLLDSVNRTFSETIATAQPGPPDGQIPAGGAARGFVTFEVPTTSTGLSIRIQGSFTAAGAQFQLS